MSQYGWVHCPDNIKTQIDTLLEPFWQVLGENLVGIYLHGSLAMGCFNTERSDIDLLVVLSQRMSIETKSRIVELLLQSSQAPSPIEISFLVEYEIRSFHHPLAFDLHYSETWRENYRQALSNREWRKWNDEIKKDTDLAAHITVTLARGICLYGKPIKNVFPPVPPRYYIAAIVGDFEDARDERTAMPVYFVLNACRVYAYLLERHIFSKDEGGAWALRCLPEEFHTTILQALEIYRGERNARPIDEAALDAFAHYVDKRIKALSEVN